MSGAKRERARRSGTTPPDPATFDASDETRFLSLRRAQQITGKGRRQLQYLAAKNPEISFYCGIELYFHRAPLATLILF